MNWGTKIVIGLATFMAFILVLGYLMFTSKKDALVDNDYYANGINYNKEYNLKEQTSLDHAKPAIVVEQQMIRLTFKQGAKGTVKLMRTSDKTLDQAMPFESDTHQQVNIPSGSLPKGSWRLIVNWTSEDKSYLYEQEITI